MSDQDRRNTHRVPRDLDAPVPIFFWEPVEFIGAVSLMGFGIILHELLFGVGAAVLVLYVSKKLKRGGAKKGQPMHILYQKGFPIDSTLKKHAPHPKIPEFLD